jgi:hypothetical protein
MNSKLIRSFGALAIAAAFVAACGEESEVDAGAARAAPAGNVHEIGWPWVEAQTPIYNHLSADAAEQAALSVRPTVFLSADAAEHAALSKVNAASTYITPDVARPRTDVLPKPLPRGGFIRS